MSEDWKPGDLALCIKQGPWIWASNNKIASELNIRCGGIYTVRCVGQSPYGFVLWFENVPGNDLNSAYGANRFRKVTPPKADEFDQETIRLLTGKPVEVVQ